LVVVVSFGSFEPVADEPAFVAGTVELHEVVVEEASGVAV